MEGKISCYNNVITRDLIEANTLKEAKTAIRASDRLRAWEILAKMGGYMKDQPQQVVGIFSSIKQDNASNASNDVSTSNTSTSKE